MQQLKIFTPEEQKQIIPEGTFLLGYVGSVAHGTHIPNTDPSSIDDKDIMGVAVGPMNCYHGLQNFEQKAVQHNEWDSVVYEVRKYFRLLLKQNPNVISLLWLNDNHYLHKSLYGKVLLDEKHLFSSKEAYHSFAGYANAQLHRMTHWKFEGYMGEKRKKLVEEFGYDVKNAAHLIRLLRMAIEFLTDGKFVVYRSDADELKDIKQGKWKLQEVKDESKKLFELAREAYVRSPLPPKPNFKKAEELLMEIVDHEALLQIKYNKILEREGH